MTRPDFDEHAVAAEGGWTIAAIVELGDENSAIMVMAASASALAKRLYDEGRIDGFIALGRTMGTDLALDVDLSLPLGVPKFVVSTNLYSRLIPPKRIATLFDDDPVSWRPLGVELHLPGSPVAGMRCGRRRRRRPVVGISSLGKSCLTYMVALKPELERRGYEVVIFHTAAQGIGRAVLGCLVRLLRAVIDPVNWPSPPHSVSS